MGSPMSRRWSRIDVRRRPGRPSEGWLTAGPLRFRAALGRGGVRADKRESDGATPRGTFRPLRLWLRPDRGSRPRTGLPVRIMRPEDGWCEDPQDRRYNRPIRLMAGGEGDRLWRADHLYDLIIEINHNARPRVAGRGSAVFLHLARPGYAPTAGCVALSRSHLRRVLAGMDRKTKIVIH
jgi:L,D-peptidoglycan transpeptidase YkuD (ErfK/YbiS/YcfS/YnhG family)